MDSSLIPIYQLFKKELEQFEIDSEEAVLSDENRYKNLDLRALYTSFPDLENIYKHPSVRGVWVDLGGGSGRSCLLYSFLTGNPSINLEIDSSRSIVASTLAKKYTLNTTSITANLLLDPIPEGDTFFLYFPTGHVLDRVLDVLSRRINFTLVVIESHGDLVARIDKEAGYQKIGTLLLQTPRHDPSVHFYHKVSLENTELSPHKLSFKDELVKVSDQQGEWVASSFGLEWLGEDNYQFIHPPRTICWKRDFVEVLDRRSDEFALIHFISEIRKQGEVKIELENGHELVGVIRKIRTSDVLRLEISTSELIEWNLIKKITQGSQLCYESSYCFFSRPAH